MNPWEFFGLSPEEYLEEMEALGWEADLDALDNKLDKFFAKASDAPRSPPCKHDWVNMGFTSMQMVCKKCDKEKT
jgi:hypothetical protein